MKGFSISVVIPNYNGRKLLEANLPSLYDALRLSKQEFEIIISDDASTDDSVTFIKKVYPDILLVQKIKNEGFSHTVNKGIEQASKQLTFILNSDVLLTGDYFSPQLKYFELENTFGVMGRIIGLYDDKIQDAAKYPEIKGFKIKSTINYLPVGKIPENDLPTLFLSGANALVDTKKLKALKGFDEIYSPFYGEDVDLSIRAWRLGWECFYEHEAICRHPVSVTIQKYNNKKKVKIISIRNRLTMHAIHHKGSSFALWLLTCIFEFIFRFITLQWVYCQGYLLFFSQIKRILNSKKNFEELMKKFNSKRSLDYILKNIKYRLQDIEINKGKI